MPMNSAVSIPAALELAYADALPILSKLPFMNLSDIPASANFSERYFRELARYGLNSGSQLFTFSNRSASLH